MLGEAVEYQFNKIRLLSALEKAISMPLSSVRTTSYR